ncbi:hypothetical protein [Hydrogenophaga sp. RWCD_12]|uniref:hypothetical protein n=1 Tax=Hydrogenophaga sp. RWCD_12 TaxID=3391190 RepID=UPI00398560C1
MANPKLAHAEGSTKSSTTLEQKPPRVQSLNWTTALSVLTALVALGSVILHFIGDVSHRQYLKFWGIDAGLFPKSTDWILINGYYSLVTRFIAILEVIFKNVHWLATAAILLGLYMGFLLTPIGSGRGVMHEWLQRRSARYRNFLRITYFTALLVGALPLAMFVLTSVMVIPAALGEEAGRAAAENELDVFRKGCSISTPRCVEARREGQLVATGFVLDSSTSYLAIFDERTQQGRVIPLDKVELVSARPIASSPKEHR